MYTILSDTGRTALGDSHTTGDKLQITRYQIGQLTGTVGEPLPSLREYGPGLDFYTLFPWLIDTAWVTAHFVERYAGNNAAISWLPIAQDMVTLKCYTPPNTDQFHFNAVTLWAEYNGDEFIFLTCYYGVTNPKFSVEVSQGGMKHYFMTTLSITNIKGKFDWTNLAFETPSVEWKETYIDFDMAHQEARDQFVLEEHFNLQGDGPLFVVNTEEQFYAAPMYPYDPTAPASDELPMLFNNGAPLRSLVADQIVAGYRINLDSDLNPILDFRGRETQVPVDPDDPDPYPYVMDNLNRPIRDDAGRLIFIAP